MTEEQANKIVELLENYKNNTVLDAVLFLIMIAVCIGATIVISYFEKKWKKERQCWLATLSEEELKVIERYKSFK